MDEVQDAYSAMVTYFPYRVLQSFSYDWDEKPMVILLLCSLFFF